ncbi:MAG: recombinase family protein [Muribaculaceae bacterium]|nr:recombinase family protein [Muribaculaceae bacterium]
MANFIAYYRVSTNKQNLGLDAQRAAVANYLRNIDSANIIAEFSEHESGKRDNRTELLSAIAECKRTNSTLIIAKLDRLSRNVSFVFSLKDSGVEFVACDLPQFNTLTLAIFIGLAQQERELISQRTKAALAVKREQLAAQGKKLGRPNASFSDKDRAKASQSNKNKSLNHPNNVKALAVIRLLLKQTCSLTEIAKHLNDGGFRTMNEKLFTPCSVSRLIKRIG